MALARAAGALTGVGALSFQDQGITCLGPYQQTLRQTQFGPLPGAWELHGPLFATITRTQTISLEMAALENLSGTVSLTFNHSSDLGTAVSWGLYHLPTGSRPITAGDPLLVSGAYPGTPFYAIATVPGGASAPKAGPYMLTITGARAADGSQYVHSVLLWLGEWTAPPGSGLNLFVPVVIRN